MAEEDVSSDLKSEDREKRIGKSSMNHDNDYVIPLHALEESFQELINDPESSAFLKAMTPSDFIDKLKDKSMTKRHNIRYSPEMDAYVFSIKTYTDFVNDVITTEFNDQILELMRKDLVEMSWDDNIQDFIFKLKEVPETDFYQNNEDA